MKRIFILLLWFLPFNLSAQKITKNVLVEGQGKTIVLLAGVLAPMAVMGDISKDLSENYRVIRMEHLNIQYAAQGTLLPKNYSAKLESEAIKNTLDSLNIREPVILVGSSYGGLMAMDFGLRYPERTASMILLEPPAFDLLIQKKVFVEGLQKTIDVSKRLTPQAEITEDDVEAFRCLAINCDTVSIRQLPQWKGWVQQKNRLRGISAAINYKVDLKKISSFKKPVLIVTGTETAIVHKRINAWLSQTFRLQTSIGIKSGHAIPSTAPKELVLAIKEFLQANGL
jgi:pimeloyl-ACP methyl ester carboxylesterase